MKRNQLTTLEKLQFGDRFHKAGDQKKAVWTLIRQADHTQYWVIKDMEKYEQKMKGNAPVVFLRSVMESPATS